MAFAPVPGMEKIEHLVILMMENRSFDHYLGALMLDPFYKKQIEGLRNPPYTNPDADGQPVASWPIDHTPGWPVDKKYFGYPDLPHGPLPQASNYNGGAMDGFVKSFAKDLVNSGSTPADVALLSKLAMGYYTRDTLPILYSLADNFTVCDHWFSSLLSSTWPNRKYLHSGLRDADNDTQSLPPFPGFLTTPMWDVLEDKLDPQGNPYTWKSYFTDLPFLAFWYKFAAFHAFHNFTSVDSFVADCQSDRLPTVSIIDPAFSLADDHPTHDVQLGQKFIGLIVDALTHSESWAKTALVITSTAQNHESRRKNANLSDRRGHALSSSQPLSHTIELGLPNRSRDPIRSYVCLPLNLSPSAKICLYRFKTELP